jgi:hypothetical protein
MLDPISLLESKIKKIGSDPVIPTKIKVMAKTLLEMACYHLHYNNSGISLFEQPSGSVMCLEYWMEEEGGEVK